MSLSGKKYVFLSCVFLVLFSCVYYWAFVFQYGSPVRAAWWLKNVYDIKENIGESITGRKIIIVSGSNSWFGMNSSIIEAATGKKVLNLSGHASLDINFHYFKLEQLIGEGDIVVMPLEGDYYFRGSEITEWFNNNMMAWGDAYLAQLPVHQYVHFLIVTPSISVFEGLTKIGGPSKMLPAKEAINEFQRMVDTEGSAWRGYSFRSMGRSGAINVDEKTTERVISTYAEGALYFPADQVVSDYFVRGYEKINRLVKKHNGKLMLTWPATIRRGISDLSLDHNQKNILALKEQLEEKNIPIFCNPALLNLDIRFFFNTNYHSNRHGGNIRSKNLALCVNNFLSGSSEMNVVFDEALQLVRKQEAFYQ